MDDETRRSLAGLLTKSLSVYYAGLRQSIASLKHAAHSTASFLDGAVFPAIDSVVQMNEQVARSLVSAVQGEREWKDVFDETTKRLDVGSRFERLVRTWGGELFGTATFEDERVLIEGDIFRLCYIPPAEDAPPAPLAVFHAGGCIPYGDRIFRMLPHYNLYERFRERGVPLYVMELRGDRDHIDYSGLTLDGLVRATAAMSDVAFAHHRDSGLPSSRRKLVLEGYCGQGTQALVYAAARPADADAKFGACCLFATPVDGSRCADLAAAARDTPDFYHDALMSYYDVLTGAAADAPAGPAQGAGYVPGESVQMGLDLPLKALFHKSSLGYFSAGWNRTDLAAVETIADLSPSQQRDVAAVYWVSTDCSRRFPLPLDIVRFTSALFKRGVGRGGVLPYPIEGREVSLRALAADTSLRFIGCYGGRDPVVPDSTAHVLASLLGERYTHVVHPQAGHISYVLSPRLWTTETGRALDPNPIDLLVHASDTDAITA